MILNLVYYTCPMLCNLILNGQTDAMHEIPGLPATSTKWSRSASIRSETFDLARKKKAIYLGSFGRPAPGWHFLADHDGNAKRLAEQVGFTTATTRGRSSSRTPAAIMILTPEGQMARYLYGVRFRSGDVRFALAEAPRAAPPWRSKRFCCAAITTIRTAGAYVCSRSNVMRAGGGLTVV